MMKMRILRMDDGRIITSWSVVGGGSNGKIKRDNM